MHQLKKLFSILLLTISLPIFSSEVLQNSPPVFSTSPVQQDASWAIEWWEPRHNEKRELAKKSNIDLLMIGDSITHGWENEGSAVWNKFYQNLNAFNLGFSGDRTEHVLWRLQHGAVDGMTPKLTVIMIGTNNTGHRMDSAAHTTKGIKAIVTEIQNRLPQSKILLLGIFPRHYSPYNEMRIRNEKINQQISLLANNKNIYYLNVNHIFLDDEKLLHPKVMPDLLHPNKLGYQLWAEAMQPTITKLMK